MKVGSLVYATEQGLGYLAKSFYDAGIVTDVLVCKHSRYPTQPWYPNAEQIKLRPFNYALAHSFCESMDVMLFFETPFQWELITHCRSMHVKTVIMPMHECMPERIPAQPDLWLCPSRLDHMCYGGGDHAAIGEVKLCATEQGMVPSVYLPVPVEGRWRQRTKAEVFVHNAGHGGLKGRNGTAELLEAIRLVKSPAKFIIRWQKDLAVPRHIYDNRNVLLEPGSIAWNELYDEGDVFVFPEKFNGLSLPLQEARAAGMLVMATDRFPNNEWFPDYAPLPVAATRKNRIGPPYREFDEAIVDPKDIAERIDAWYGQDIADYSLSGKQWAEENSWKALKPRYKQLLEQL